jgi:hypothetical protein
LVWAINRRLVIGDQQVQAYSALALSLNEQDSSGLLQECEQCPTK